MVLHLANRSLVRIDGLERATTLKTLLVRRPISTVLVSNLTYSRFRSAQHQLLRRRACMCARVDTARLAQRESRSLSSYCLLTPVQLSYNCLSSVPAAIGHMTALTELTVSADSAFALARLIGPRLLALWESPPRSASRDRPLAIAALFVGTCLVQCALLADWLSCSWAPMRSSAFRQSWPTCNPLNGSVCVCLDLMLFSTHHNCSSL
jgi:hypothetical protein